MSFGYCQGHSGCCVQNTLNRSKRKRQEMSQEAWTETWARADRGSGQGGQDGDGEKGLESGDNSQSVKGVGPVRSLRRRTCRAESGCEDRRCGKSTDLRAKYESFPPGPITPSLCGLESAP